MTGTTTAEALRASARVIWAVALRDLRTRFFNHGLGYLIAIGFPLGHILILLAIWTAFGRSAPFGDSAVVFFGTALAPFMAWMYMSRYIMLSLIINRPLLAFPAVNLLDIVMGRALLETLGSFCMIGVLVALAYFFDLPYRPYDVVEVASAVAVALLLGFGFGLVAALMAAAASSVVMVYMLLQILVYFASGIMFLPSSLPRWLVEILAWLPTFHIVEWARVGFFDGYPAPDLDRGYAVAWAVGSVAFGLLLERAARGRLLEG